MKKVFLEELPKKKWNGTLCIDWINSVGCTVEFIYEDIQGEIEIVDYIKKKQKLVIKYKNEINEISTNVFSKCSIGRIIGKITKDFKININTIIKDSNRDMIILNREYRKEEKIDKEGRKSIYNLKWYQYKCNICGWDKGWIREDHLLKGVGCSCCSGLTVVKNINDIATTNPEMIKYFVNIEDCYTYTYNSKNKVLLKCPYCGLKKKMNIYVLFNQGFSCSKCSDGCSYPNKFMLNLLEQFKVEFKTEYSPKWIKPKRYDFYIPSMKLIIEMDGGFHNKYNNLNGQTKEHSKEIDNYKDKLAEEHGLKIIRIDCDYKNTNKFNYIKTNVLNSKLNEFFKLNNINWYEIDKNSENNKVKIVCDYKKQNENLTSKNIGDKLKLNRSTVIKYLKKGNNLGWCNYNPKEEMRKSANSNRPK